MTMGNVFKKTKQREIEIVNVVRKNDLLRYPYI